MAQDAAARLVMTVSHDQHGADPHHDNGAVYLVVLRDTKDADTEAEPLTVRGGTGPLFMWLRFWPCGAGSFVRIYLLALMWSTHIFTKRA